MNPNAIKAIVRSITPSLYAGVAAIIAHFGYHVGNATVIQIAAAAYAGLTVILHAAETRWPWVGGLLGWFGAPQYTPSTKVTLVQVQAELDALKAQQHEAANPTVPTAPVVSPPGAMAPPTPIIPPVTPYLG